MKYQLSCGDAVPGCSARFEDESRDVIMDQVARHAREDHGVVDVTPEMLAAIGANIVSA
jgi:predicted small metal-binding protein